MSVSPALDLVASGRGPSRVIGTEQSNGRVRRAETGIVTGDWLLVTMLLSAVLPFLCEYVALQRY